MADKGGMHPLRGLIPVEEALERVAAWATPIARFERVDLADACGRVVSEDLRAPFDFPAFDRSRMDGYAVVASDLAAASAASPRKLKLIGRALAGAPFAGGFGPGACVEVATGAPLPLHADSVVPAEDASAAHGGAPGVAGSVEFRAPAPRGQFVSRKGSDFRAGEVLLRAGDRLTPSKVAAAAAGEAASLAVRARPRVLVVPTGDEVVPLGAPLPAGSVRESNSHALAAFVLARGALPVRHAVVRDTMGDVLRALGEAAAFDAAVFTGGSSAGSRDFLAEALASVGAVAFHGVRLRPGKPVLFGRAPSCPVLVLPGNPTSCMIGAHLFLDRLLAGLSGAPPLPPTSTRARLSGDVAPYARASPADFLTLVLVRLDGREAVPIIKDSITVMGAASADGYIAIAPGSAPPLDGDEVQVVLLR